MTNKYMLWQSGQQQVLVAGKNCEFSGNWPGIADLVLARHGEDKDLAIEMFSLGGGGITSSFASAFLKANIKRSPRSSDFFGYLQVTENIKLKVWVWMGQTSSNAPYLSCSVEEIQSRSGSEEGDLDGEKSPAIANEQEREVGVEREHATLLAALRFWANNGLGAQVPEMGIATNGGKFDCLSLKEIDSLRERMNALFKDSKVVVNLRDGHIESIESDRNVNVTVNQVRAGGLFAERTANRQ
jgi:hypothetical protein